MKIIRTLTLLSAATALSAALHAQTWVSASGSDSGSCTLTAPCKTFAYAATQTPVWGQLGVLTRGDYGPVTLTQSITIDGGGLAANVSTTGNAITVQVPAGNVVQLHNLSLHGNGAANGIYFTTSGQLELDHLEITGFGNCINLYESGSNSTDLVIKDTTIDNCAVDGIRLSSAPSSTPALTAKIVNTHVGFANHGLYVDNGLVTISNSTFSSPGKGSGTTGIQAQGAYVFLDSCQVIGFYYGLVNSLYGTPAAYTQISRSSFVGNSDPILNQSGQVISNGNNSFFNNQSSVELSSTVPLQ